MSDQNPSADAILVGVAIITARNSSALARDGLLTDDDLAVIVVQLRDVAGVAEEIGNTEVASELRLHAKMLEARRSRGRRSPDG